MGTRPIANTVVDVMARVASWRPFAMLCWSLKRPINRILGVLSILVAASPAWSAIGIDQVRSTARSSASTTITSPTISTTSANELLLAFVATDAKSAGMTVTGVTGGGLTWSLVRRTNAQLGTAEIWRAVAPSILANITVRATLAQSVAASITVVTLTGVDVSGSGGSAAIGATASANSGSGVPTASLTTTRDGSWVFGVGNDWDNAVARVVPADQTIVQQYLATVGDTFWVQRQATPTAASGTTVTINDTAPTTDRFNLTLVEVRAALPAGATYNVSGSITPAILGAGATVALGQGAATVATAIVDGSGNYTFAAVTNGAYVVTPTKPGIIFSPASQSFSVSGANVTLAAFDATVPPPVLAVSPASLAFSYAQGGILPSASTLTIANSGGGTLNFTAAGNTPWLTIAPAGGTAPATVSVGASPAALTPGTYPGQVTIIANGATGSPATIPVTLTVTAPGVIGPDWLTIGRDPARTGFAANDTVINKTNVANLALLWTASLDGKVMAQPLYAKAVDIGGTARDVVVAATAQNTLYALDATSGAQIWSRNFGPDYTDGCVSIPGGTGIRSTPVIDRVRGRIYVAAEGGALFTVSLVNGTNLAAPLQLVDLPKTNKVRGGLNLVGNNLYVATGSGGCDIDPWRGRIYRVDVSGAVPVLATTFDVVPGLSGDSRGGGIWGYAGVSVDPVSGNVYAATGADRNKLYTPYAVRMLALDSALNLLGSYEPPHVPNWSCPAEPCDQDFGATPTVFQADGCPAMVAAGNKNGEFYVLRAADLAASGPPLQALRLNIAFDPLDRGGVGGSAAFWAAGRMLFVSTSGPGINGIPSGVIGLSIAPAPTCSLAVAWASPLPQLQRAQSSPTVAGDVVFVGEGADGRVHAYDAASGAELWNSGNVIGGGTFGAPMVADGKLFVGSWGGFSTSDAGMVRAFAPAAPPTCLGAQPTVLFGTQTVGTIPDNVSLGVAEAFGVTAAGCGDLASVSLYVDAGSTAARVIVGIYSNNAGHPGSLLATGSLAAPVSAAWNSIPVSATAITVGGQYWIAVLGAGSGVIRFRDQLGGCTSETSAQSNLIAMPTVWTSGASYTTCPVSAYGVRAP